MDPWLLPWAPTQAAADRHRHQLLRHHHRVRPRRWRHRTVTDAAAGRACLGNDGPLRPKTATRGGSLGQDIAFFLPSLEPSAKHSTPTTAHPPPTLIRYGLGTEYGLGGLSSNWSDPARHTWAALPLPIRTNSPMRASCSVALPLLWGPAVERSRGKRQQQHSPRVGQGTTDGATGVADPSSKHHAHWLALS